MRSLRFLFSVAMSFLVALASAQTIQMDATGSGGTSSSASIDNYSRFKVNYLIVNTSFDTKFSSPLNDEFSINGVSFEYLYGQHIFRNMPIFLEYGLNMSWGINTRDGYYDSFTTNVVNITVPVNLAYNWALNDNMTINPHVGLGMRFNVLAKSSYSGESISWFDKNDVGTSNTWNRFQLCGQVGIGISLRRFYLGWEYSWNFMKLTEKMKFNTHYISVGYNF